MIVTYSSQKRFCMVNHLGLAHWYAPLISFLHQISIAFWCYRGCRCSGGILAPLSTPQTLQVHIHLNNYCSISDLVQYIIQWWHYSNPFYTGMPSHGQSTCLCWCSSIMVLLPQTKPLLHWNALERSSYWFLISAMHFKCKTILVFCNTQYCWLKI